MSVRSIGNRWQVRLRLGGNHPRFEQTLPPGATKADALQLEAKVRRSQIDVALGKKPTYLIDDVLDQWQRTGAERLKSWKKDLKYRFSTLRQEYTHGKRLDQIIDVAEQIKADCRELNPATVNRYLALLRRCGNLAELWGWTDAPLGRRIKLLPENTDRHVYLTAPEVERLAKAAGEAGDMVRFAALSGLRRGEMLRLKPEQIVGDVLVMGTLTKTMRPRGIPLPPEALEIASRCLPWALTEKQLRDRFEAARVAVGRPDVHFHDLRHTYASWLTQAGQSERVVGALLGHSSPSVTRRYAHLAPTQFTDAVKTLPTLGKVGKRRGLPRKKKVA